MIMLMLLMIMFILILMFMCSSSFIMSWILLECNTMSFLSLMCLNSKLHKFSFLSSYFLIQVLSSSLLLVSLGLMNLELNLLISSMYMLYNFSLCIKIGLAPFHMWVVNLSVSSSWLGIFMLSSVQKIMPMILLSWNMMSWFIIILSIYSLLVVIYNMLGLISIKLIFGYSMLTHSSWMSLMLVNMYWWLIYFILYTFLLMLICVVNSFLRVEDISDMSKLSSLNIFMKVFYMLNLLSMMGLPPFVGFLIKWMILSELFSFISYFIVLLIILTSLINLYMYMRLLLWVMFIYSGKSVQFKNFFWNKVILMNYYVYFSSFILIFLMYYLINL
uniref:NADH-ubiquinone oxidoreductase chain 2 n=1 Tax=Agenioideus sp. SJW-2017 TaxID=1940100 RepID=A0A1P8VH72_9HYME|nr:NADH dehydrogenase subunit 2 [Agenioideus sp. SJW-2017]